MTSEKEELIEDFEKTKGLTRIRLDKLKRGKKQFLSTGISNVKVTKDREVICYEIPIQSTGISELMESFQGTAPTPPLVNMLVDPQGDNAAIAKDLGLTKKTWIKLPDYANKDYIAAKDKHNSDLGIAILLKGLAVKLYDENDNEITDPQELIDTLKGEGMSGDQFQQVVNDITSLTRWTDEERTTFFG